MYQSDKTPNLREYLCSKSVDNTTFMWKQLACYNTMDDSPFQQLPPFLTLSPAFPGSPVELPAVGGGEGGGWGRGERERGREHTHQVLLEDDLLPPVDQHNQPEMMGPPIHTHTHAHRKYM